MTLVSTSRKPVPELRTLARDLAFSTGSRYLTRGKRGIAELLAGDETVILVGGDRASHVLQVFSRGEEVASVGFGGWTVDRRDGALVKGLGIANQSVYESLREYVDAHPEGTEGQKLVFDGAQRRRYVLDLKR